MCCYIFEEKEIKMLFHIIPPPTSGNFSRLIFAASMNF